MTISPLTHTHGIGLAIGGPAVAEIMLGRTLQLAQAASTCGHPDFPLKACRTIKATDTRAARLSTGLSWSADRMPSAHVASRGSIRPHRVRSGARQHACAASPMVQLTSHHHVGIRLGLPLTATAALCPILQLPAHPAIHIGLSRLLPAHHVDSQKHGAQPGATSLHQMGHASPCRQRLAELKPRIPNAGPEQQQAMLRAPQAAAKRQEDAVRPSRHTVPLSTTIHFSPNIHVHEARPQQAHHSCMQQGLKQSFADFCDLMARYTHEHGRLAYGGNL